MAQAPSTPLNATPASLSSQLAIIFSLETLFHAIAGTLGGFVTMSCFYPMDLVRSNMQAMEKYKGKSAMEVAHLLMKQDGISALYRGLGPLLVALAASNFTYFYVNNLLKAFVKMKQKRSVTIWENILLNIIAGCVNVLVTNPLWVVSTRLKLQKRKKQQQQQQQQGAASLASENDVRNMKKKSSSQQRYKGIVDTFEKIISNEGVPALWKGTVASLILVLNPTIQFVTYDKLKQFWLKKAMPTTLQAFVLAAAAKLVASCATYPLQTVQAKIRVDKAGKYKNTWECFKYIVKHDGVRGLFQGLDLNAVQKVSMAAFHFTIYEKILNFIFVLFRIKASIH